MWFGTFTLVASLLSIAQANNILFYETNTCSAGEYSGCYNIGSGTCCTTSVENEAAAISISKAPLDFATMWSGGGCTTQQCSYGGSGTVCCIWNGVEFLTGGLFNTLSASKREDPQSAVNCTQKMEANVFGYASETDGAWEIRADDLQNMSTQEDTFGQLHKEFRKVASGEKMAWLQAHGAVRKAHLHDEQVTNIDNNDA